MIFKLMIAYIYKHLRILMIYIYVMWISREYSWFIKLNDLNDVELNSCRECSKMQGKWDEMGIQMDMYWEYHWYKSRSISLPRVGKYGVLKSSFYDRIWKWWECLLNMGISLDCWSEIFAIMKIYSNQQEWWYDEMELGYTSY